MIRAAQRAKKKALSDSPGLVDFPVGLVNSVRKFLRQLKLQKYCKRTFLGGGGEAGENNFRARTS